MADHPTARESRHPSDDEEIHLEPSIPPEADFPSDGDSADESDTWLGSSLVDFGELTALLRDRLRAAAGFVALAYVPFVLFSLTLSEDIYRLAGWSLALRCLLAVSVFGLLASRTALSYWKLRGIEYFFFGVDTLLMLAVQYSINIELAQRGELHGIVAVEKNGVLRTFIMMMIYGVFIPNHPKMTSRVVLTMAAGPIIVLALIMHRVLEATAIGGQMASFQNVVSNSLFLLIGAALSIFSAHVLNGMRKDVSAARRLGRYRLLEKLGEGGMGEVYLAEHELLKRPCALKLINADLEDNTIALARFEREVQATAMLSHPNTIEIYDYGRADDGTFYYVMEYLPGMSVAELVHRDGPLPPGRAVYIMRQACGSLAEAHRLGLIHRDLKPGNILVAILGGKCDVAKVLDFGLVKLTDPASQQAPQLTAQYTVSGSPSYMSPEQAMATKEIDGRSDLYALGAILYFMLTGKPPFERDSSMSLMIAHTSEPVRPPSELQPGIPADLEAVVLRCLAKAPADRYPDARSLAAALGNCACAADWDEARAEQWWLEQSAKHTPPHHDSAPVSV